MAGPEIDQADTGFMSATAEEWEQAKCPTVTVQESSVSFGKHRTQTPKLDVDVDHVCSFYLPKESTVT